MSINTSTLYYNWNLYTSYEEHKNDIYDDFKKIINKKIKILNITTFILFINTYKIEKKRLYPVKEETVILLLEPCNIINFMEECDKKLISYSDEIKNKLRCQIMRFYFFSDILNNNLSFDCYENSSNCIFSACYRPEKMTDYKSAAAPVITSENLHLCGIRNEA